VTFGSSPASQNKLEWFFLEDPEELGLAIEGALADFNIRHWVKVSDEWIRLLQQCIDGGEESLEQRQMANSDRMGRKLFGLAQQLSVAPVEHDERKPHQQFTANL
jgi:hypothetical protein